jgi:hypothetical protein
MVALNIFRNDAFSALSLTQAIERQPYNPTGLGDLGIFTDMPIRTDTAMIEERDGQLVVIPFSERGAPATERTTEKRKARYFDVPRLLHGDTLHARELQNIRAFGQETELMQVQEEVARRLSGPMGLMSSMEYTWEYHRLAAIQGLLLDADGSTKYDYFAEFGFSAPTEVDFALAAKTVGSLRPLCNGLVRTMARAAKGAFLPSTRVAALAGDSFYDKLVTHPDVVETYKNWNAAAELRGDSMGAFQRFPFAGIDWINYRGSDDTTTIAVGLDQGQVLPDRRARHLPTGIVAGGDLRLRQYPRQAALRDPDLRQGPQRMVAAGAVQLSAAHLHPSGSAPDRPRVGRSLRHGHRLGRGRARPDDGRVRRCRDLPPGDGRGLRHRRRRLR